ncbi:MAG: mechanosensitive ion channel family protein [Betaproteobacteria bacterium]
MTHRLFDQLPPWPALVAALAAILAVAYAAGEVTARLARAVLLLVMRGERNVQFAGPIVRRPIRLIRVFVWLATVALLLVPTAKMAGVPLAVGPDPNMLLSWILGSGLRIVLISIMAYALVRVVAAMVRRFEEEIRHDEAVNALERVKRARTLGALIENVSSVAIAATAALMILKELQVDIMPILTGAGIAGLAVGFGAQTLVRDIIGGFFMIFENQVRVGDVAVINGTGGLVEAINLRTIVLRDLEGVVHVFPNGAIDRLANMTRDFSYYVVDVGVAYKEDTDVVAAVLEEVGAGLQADPAYGPNILAPLEVLGVDAFGDSAVTIKIRIKTVPLKQWDVGRELRRRIKKAFDARRIEIPFPHLSVYFGEASRPFEIRQTASVS